MKKVILIGGESKGSIGITVDIGPEHQLVRKADGTLEIVWDRHLMDMTPEMEKILDGLPPEALQEVIDDYNKNGGGKPC